MSRTVKGSKSPWFEIWGKRGFTGWANGWYVKAKTHRVERKQGKEQVAKELKESRDALD